MKFCPVLISTALSGEIWIHSIELGINGDESNILKMDQHIGVDSDDQMQHHRGSVTCCDVIHMDVCRKDGVCCGEVMLIVTGGIDKSIKVWTCATDALRVLDEAFKYVVFERGVRARSARIPFHYSLEDHSSTSTVGMC